MTAPDPATTDLVPVAAINAAYAACEGQSKWPTLWPGQMKRILDAAAPLIAADERPRKLVIVWRDERLNEICRSTPVGPGDTKVAIPLDAFCADLLEGDDGD